MQPRDIEPMKQWVSKSLVNANIRTLALILVLLTATAYPHPSTAAPVLQGEVWAITSPVEGSTVSGEVPILGTATHPNFTSYDVLYAPGPRPTGTSQWVHIVAGANNMVVNGTLATWDTTQIPNGQYTLALAVWEPGSTDPHLHFTNNITVVNEETTPTPEPTETPEPEATEAIATEEAAAPPPAPTIQQPPTATPRPTATLAAESTAPEGEDGDSDGGLPNPADILSLDAIKEAFTMGAQLAFLLYALGILYFLAKAVIRYYLRQTRGKSNS